MMEEHLRDNVERLLASKPARPSSEFKARMHGLLLISETPRRQRALLSLAAVAAAFAFICWLTWDESRREPRTGDASVKGTVTFKGALPHKKMLQMAGDPECEKLYPNGMEYLPIAVDRSGRLEGCLVYVKKGLEGKTFDPPSQPLKLAFENCRLKPEVAGIMAGQKLLVECRTDDVHAVRALPNKNKQQNSHLRRGDTAEMTFTTHELGFKVRCDRHHGREICWLSVFTHPYFAVTDAQGRFEIPGLPPGKYTLEAWQKYCTPVTRDVQVMAGEPVTADFSIDATTLPASMGQIDEDQVRGCLGRTTEVQGAMEWLPLSADGTSSVKLLVSTWVGICRLDPAAADVLKELPKHSWIVLRGTCRGLVGNKEFLMEGCTVVEILYRGR